MIDYSNFIIKETLRKNSRYKNEVNRCTYYHCTCDKCDKDKGYQRKSRYLKKPLCVKCATNEQNHKDTLKGNHWSKTGVYSPKVYITQEQQLQKRERELSWNRQYYKQYYQDNKENIIKKRNNHLCNNINAKIASKLRTRLYQAIKINKAGSAVSDLGCSIQEFRFYIESKWQSGMAWSNWTMDGWHIDHIKPLFDFDLTDREQFKKACHYTNLQPLWAKENLSKNRWH